VSLQLFNDLSEYSDASPRERRPQGVGNSKCMRRSDDENSRTSRFTQVPCASPSNSVVTALDSDQSMSSRGPSDNRKHKQDDVITPLRHVTSDVTGTPMLHSTPVRTPATTVSAPNLTGKPIMHCLGLNKERYA